MEFITNPQSKDIVFSIASLVLVAITFLIHISEEKFYNRQGCVFGAFVSTALLVSILEIFHNAYLYDDAVKAVIGFEVNKYIVLVEKILIYFISYFSINYVMAIFQIEDDTFIKKAIILVPTLHSAIIFAFGFFENSPFFYFDQEGVLKYNYPQGIAVNIGIWLYFIFALYMLIRYTRTLSSEKAIAIWVYFLLMLTSIPVRIITKSSSVFEFSVAISLLLCVYTFQNPSEFIDRMSGAGTRNALDFTIGTNLLQKKDFTILGIHITHFSVILGKETPETAADLKLQIAQYFKQFCQYGALFYPDADEFILTFNGMAPDETIINNTEEQIKKRFKENWKVNGHEIKLFESPYTIGFPDEVDSLERYREVMSVMEKALTRQNREILRVSDLNMKVVEHDKKIDGIVKRALEDNLLEVYYQPIYSPDTGKFTSCEALLRLKDPQLGFISPAIFMPIAERNGTILDIDRFVLSSVCEMIATSDARKYGLEYVEVNLSVVDCIQTNLADNVMKTLEKYKVKPSEINLEITETYEEGITSVMYENINKLTQNGISFSMDDFGTGYSNLARIGNIPVKIFKLDKSIVQSAFDSEVSYMVMLNMVKIIKSLNREIVAEGVETGEQARQIIKLGCDHIQGFFYSRPIPKDAFVAFLRDHND